ncbi:protein C9orf78, putative [Pediculus humanus corporis]|uniref:Protein C9orf78, putative n=1 Tax=Pediculus humanus subsp. corporis TaxID=121224 RepID=E0VEC9_PEDHC|nr:protein C9orf78, putative [Pediculus humanus corporis]EEB11735.1 protein C9orf78, putative [Pediculus humanus corporis]
MAEGESEAKDKIQFNKKKRIKNRRKSLPTSDDDAGENEDDDDDDDDVRTKLEEMKMLQKLRARPNGVNIVGLALGRKIGEEEEEDIDVKDPFKTKSGGMINMKTLKSGKIKKMDDAYDTGIGTQFSAETNKRDEDEEMMKFIEDQLSKKKGLMKEKKSGKSDDQDESSKSKYCSPEEAALQAIPDHLRSSSMQRSEEMLSHQMLSGIPEVDLGIDAKIRNIEATEEAKLKLLWSEHNKKEGPSQFVPSNITVNFMQQNKMNQDDLEPLRKRQKNYKRPTVQILDDAKIAIKRKEGEKATDDYHYERFKKQFRRY